MSCGVYTLSGLPGERQASPPLAYFRKLLGMPEGGGDSTGHRTVGRIDDVLDLVARRGELSLSRIAHEIDAPISSTRDLLSGLVHRGYLRRDGMGYQLGERHFLLGVLAGRPVPHGLTHEDVAALSQIAGAPVMLALLIQDTIYYVDHAGGSSAVPQRLVSIVETGQPRPALRTAAGRLLAAIGENADRPRLFTALKAADPPAFAHFMSELPEIRRVRRARSDGLADPDIRAVAVPVLFNGVITAAAVVVRRRVGPKDRIFALDAAAQRLSRALPERPGGGSVGRGAPQDR
jgi:DNA-binding IclR family transcriptional regulator